jgi:hypothetical protein
MLLVIEQRTIVHERARKWTLRSQPMRIDGSPLSSSEFKLAMSRWIELLCRHSVGGPKKDQFLAKD